MSVIHVRQVRCSCSSFFFASSSILQKTRKDKYLASLLGDGNFPFILRMGIKRAVLSPRASVQRTAYNAGLLSTSEIGYRRDTAFLAAIFDDFRIN